MKTTPPMDNPDQRERVFFEAARRFADPTERRAFLDHACIGDPEMRQRLEEMLTGQTAANQFFDEGAAALGVAGTIRISATEVQITEKAGDRIGRYKLLEKIGEGGCGVVYVAEQEEPVRRRVALKVIKLGMDTKGVVARFEAERQALAMMDHPNIAKVLDAGSTEAGRPYFVMELVRGVKITDYCDQSKLGPRDRLDLFVKVCQAIQHAHQKGIIHRDIKPSNILVTLHDGVPVPKVIDFGIAKATEGRLTDRTVYTELHQFIGTPAYMSPEQAEMSGLDIDTRSDIYSLGVLLYELLTGHTPFDPKELLNRGLDEIRRTIREVEPPRPSTRLSTLNQGDLDTVAKLRGIASPRLQMLVRGDLDWIVMKALEKDRTRRYETANGLAADITRHLNSEPVLARPPSTAYRLSRAARKHRLAFGAVSAVTLALLIGMIISAWEAARARRAERLADHGRLESERAREEAESVSSFLTDMFKSPDPARDGRSITVIETLDRAVKWLDTSLTNQPARKARMLGTLASTYQSLGLPRQAIPLLEKARDCYRNGYGPEHPDALHAMQELAAAYDRGGRREEALRLRDQVLMLSRKVNGTAHPQTVKATFSLVASYLAAGRKEEAVTLMENMLNVSRSVNGSEHPLTIGAMHGLAWVYFQVGRRDEAVKLGEQALSLSRKVSGPELTDALKELGSLPALYAEDAQERDLAIKLEEDALTLTLRVKGKEQAGTLGMMGSLAEAYANSGRRGKALQLREEIVTLSRKVNGEEHPDTLSAMQNLGDAYAENGRHSDALRLREDVLRLRKKVNGTEHPDTLAALSALAGSFDAVGRKEETLKLREEVLTLSRKVNGEEHPETIVAMANLACSVANTGRIEDALKRFEESLRLSQKINGPEDPNTIGIMASFATVYFGANRVNEGSRLMGETVELSRKVNGPEHPFTLWVTQLLAGAYNNAGRKEEAIRLLEEILSVQKKVNGAEHPETITAMVELGTSYASTARTEEAIKMLEEALRLSRKVNGSTHRDTIWVLSNMAIAYEQAHRFADATRVQDDLLALGQQDKGPEHPDVLRALENLALSYNETGRYGDVLKVREAIVNLQLKVKGPENSDTLGAMHNLASSYGGITGRRADALKLREEIVKIRTKLNGPDHPLTLMAMVNLADSYADAGRRSEALELRERAFRLMTKVNGPDDPGTVNAMLQVANSYIDTGRTAEAIKLCEQVVELRERLFGAAHRETISAKADLAIAYAQGNRTNEADRLLSEVAASREPDPFMACKVAFSELWFGMDPEFGKLRQQILRSVTNSPRPAELSCAAKLACVRPIPDLSMQEATLALSRRAIGLVQDESWVFLYQLVLGMAEYRADHFREAEQALLAAEQGAKAHPGGPCPVAVQSAARLYRVMALTRQGQTSEANGLLVDAQVSMKPLPSGPDAKNPLVDGASYEDMIAWFAFQEATELLLIHQAAPSKNSNGN